MASSRKIFVALVFLLLIYVGQYAWFYLRNGEFNDSNKIENKNNNDNNDLRVILSKMNGMEQKMNEILKNQEELLKEIEENKFTEIEENKSIEIEEDKEYEIKKQKTTMKSQESQEKEINQPKIKINVSEKAIEMCNVCFWNTYETTTVFIKEKEHTYVFTGDIDDMWIRDSSAQVHPYIPYSRDHPTFRRLIEGLLRRQAMYINYDPYGNSYRIDTNYKFNSHQIALGRHGYVATKNYELDSGCYYLRLLYLFWKEIPETEVIHETEIKLAAEALVELWIVEQNHERDSPYRYIELPRGGLGTPVGYTGMSWTGFRPSDNQPHYGYLVPANMFTVVALDYLIEISRSIWKDEDLASKAEILRNQIDQGIQDFAIVDDIDYGKVYAFEVDGLGNYAIMDDANIPSLLSIPYLGYKYDPIIYANTRKLILSKKNPYYYEGKYAKGIGSSHATQGHIWHMSVIMRGLTSDDPKEIQEVLDSLLATDAGTKKMHEGFDPNNPHIFTRSWFAWSNALFAEFVQKYIPKGLCPNQFNFDTLQNPTRITEDNK